MGTVTGPAYYDREKNIEATGPDRKYSNHLNVRWHDSPRDKEFDCIVFGMQTIYEIPESKYQELVGEPVEDTVAIVEQSVENRTEFVLEKYLEEFIVSNFAKIFGDKLVIYRDPEEDTIAQQYATDVGVIDILAQEPGTNDFVVIELKRGRESDRVVGQTLRYMGWVRENLCRDGQVVKGIIICRESDPKLSYALRMTDNVAVNYYRVDFELSDASFDE